MDLSPEFMKQFSGSASANVVTVVLISVVMLIKRCIDKPSNYSHSKCTSCCLSVELDKDSDDESEDDIERGIQEKVESRLQQLLSKYDHDVHAQHIPSVQDVESRRREAAEQFKLAVSEKVAEELRFPEIVSPPGAVPRRNQGEPGVRKQPGQV